MHRGGGTTATTLTTAQVRVPDAESSGDRPGQHGRAEHQLRDVDPHGARRDRRLAGRAGIRLSELKYRASRAARRAAQHPARQAQQHGEAGSGDGDDQPMPISSAVVGISAQMRKPKTKNSGVGGNSPSVAVSSTPPTMTQPEH